MLNNVKIGDSTRRLARPNQNLEFLVVADMILLLKSRLHVVMGGTRQGVK